MSKPQQAAYKRSWKNYLLNARYQLRFTLFLVVLCAALMMMLGWWVDDLGRGLHRAAPNLIEGKWPSVMSEADSATKVGVITIQGSTFDWSDPARDDTLKAAKMAALESGMVTLQWMLAGTVLLLSVGLFLYGIKMTHKVAGPLFKIGLYLDKVKAGKYDKVYNLRKGDQLVAFFNHFKEAHGALRKLQERDVLILKEFVAAAERSGLAGQSPPVGEALADVKKVLEKKEAGLV